ncbi:MAG: GTP-binding protein, partial [Cetobacterium sp.]
MKNLVIGTAGHIDHGKTTLVKMLTNIDTDNLKEEKERGMTIDLGFAPLLTPDEDIISIVDVPGHEKFIKNMVAGAKGIDFVLFLIACDDGIMPQTIEHKEILKLLGVDKGILVLSKRDLVSDF